MASSAEARKHYRSHPRALLPTSNLLERDASLAYFST